MPELQKSPRSAIIQQILASIAGPGQRIETKAEALSEAAKPIVAAILQKKEQKEQEAEINTANELFKQAFSEHSKDGQLNTVEFGKALMGNKNTAGIGQQLLLQSAQQTKDGKVDLKFARVDGESEPQAVFLNDLGKVTFRKDGREVPPGALRGFVGTRQQTETGPPGSFTQSVTPKGKEDAARKKRGQINVREEITNFLTAAEASPGATGVRGAVSEKVGGLISQVFGTSAGDSVSAVISDASPEEVRAVRTRARNLVAKLIPEISGDNSGRYTEQERAITEKAQASLDPTASIDQVVTAAKTLMSLSLEGEYRDDILENRKPQFDIKDEAGQEGYVRNIMSLGLSEDAAIDILVRNLQFLERNNAQPTR